MQGSTNVDDKPVSWSSTACDRDYSCHVCVSDAQIILTYKLLVICTKNINYSYTMHFIVAYLVNMSYDRDMQFLHISEGSLESEAA